ncbi:MAG: hypothetical protein H6712_33730 [Myxococcales bacterium]|nr:hypothetical protein [Myxococcales bacterium]
MALGSAAQRRDVQSGTLDVGRLFTDTKALYLETRAQAAETGDPNLRVARMYSIVDLIGNLLNEITSIRAKITRGEEGLAGFDDDLAGLKLRYRNLYWPFFREPEPPPPTEWTEQQWTDFETLIEGPILLWDIRTCRERWEIHDVAPPCEGPDLLLALQLLRQTGVALEFQEELVASWYGFADLSMGEFLKFYGDLGRAAGKAIAGGMAAIGEGIGSYVTHGDGGGSNGFGWGLGVAAVLGAGGLVWWKTKKGK